jgi:hypothetical protein
MMYRGSSEQRIVQNADEEQAAAAGFQPHSPIAGCELSTLVL